MGVVERVFEVGDVLGRAGGGSMGEWERVVKVKKGSEGIDMGRTAI